VSPSTKHWQPDSGILKSNQRDRSGSRRFHFLDFYLAGVVVAIAPCRSRKSSKCSKLVVVLRKEVLITLLGQLRVFGALTICAIAYLASGRDGIFGSPFGWMAGGIDGGKNLDWNRDYGRSMVLIFNASMYYN